MDNDEKADVDLNAKCSTRQEQHDLFVIFRREELEERFMVIRGAS